MSAPITELDSMYRSQLYEHIAALEAQVARLTHPRIYIGTYYANADVPERCPDCDGRDFISYGVTSLICKNCWLTAELDKAETQVQQLREALKNALAVFDSMDVYSRYAPVRDQMSAALAATEPK